MEKCQPEDRATHTRTSLRGLVSYGLAILLLSMLLAGCSSRNGQGRFAVAISQADAAQFEPGSLTIPRGATVVWQNKDTALHTVTCDPALTQQQGTYSELPEGAKPWDSGDLATGQTWSYTFDTPGQYIYFSRRDTVDRLMGTIVVSP